MKKKLSPKPKNSAKLKASKPHRLPKPAKVAKPHKLRSTPRSRLRSTARERYEERIEQERRDMPEHLRHLRVKKKKGMSLAESAAHWEHEHPEEAGAMLAERAERQALAMMRKGDEVKPVISHFKKANVLYTKIKIYRPITDKSKHFSEPLPF